MVVVAREVDGDLAADAAGGADDEGHGAVGGLGGGLCHCGVVGMLREAGVQVRDTMVVFWVLWVSGSKGNRGGGDSGRYCGCRVFVRRVAVAVPSRSECLVRSRLRRLLFLLGRGTQTNSDPALSFSPLFSQDQTNSTYLFLALPNRTLVVIYPSSLHSSRFRNPRMV